MKKRVLLAALTLILALAACSGEAPTAASAPERASFDGGSLGPGHRNVEPESPPTDSATAERGGSLGPGH